MLQDDRVGEYRRRAIETLQAAEAATHEPTRAKLRQDAELWIRMAAYEEKKLQQQ